METASDIKQINQLSTDGLCLHCRLPLDNKSVAQTSLANDTERFCCSGCETVYALIHELSLDSFYKYRDNSDSNLSAVTSAKTSFEHFDDPLILERNAKPVVGGYTIVLGVQRIHCYACVWLLEKIALQIKGVSSCRVSLAASNVQIVFNLADVKLSAIAAHFQRFGYILFELDDHSESVARTKFERDFLARIGVAGFCAGNTMLIAICLYQGLFTGIEDKFGNLFRWVSLAFSIPAMFYSAVPFYRGSWAGLKAGLIHIDLPISLGIIVGFIASIHATIFASEHVYFDSICILVFFLLSGRWLQYRMLQKSQKSFERTSALPTAAKKIHNGVVQNCLVERLEQGDRIMVDHQSRIPVDGILESDRASLNNAHLTGESRPINVANGGQVFAGAINLGSAIELSVTATGAATRLGKVLELMRRSLDNRPLLLNLTTRLSIIFTITVITVSVATLFLVGRNDLADAIERIVALLVITCPCALGLSAPLASSISVARAANQGILIKHADTFERVLSVKQIVFDKTGTLTTGQMKVVGVYNENAELVMLSAQEKAIIFQMEQNIEHPVAYALTEYLSDCHINDLSNDLMLEYKIGKGVAAHDKDGNNYCLGSCDWILDNTQKNPKLTELLIKLSEAGHTTLVFCRNSDKKLIFALGDNVCEEAKELLDQLESFDVSILSGDSTAAVNHVAEKLNHKFLTIKGSQCPEAKLEYIQAANAAQPVMMVGDGVNDAAALGAATIGVGVRGGVEACLQAADVFIGSGKLLSIAELIKGSKQTVFTVKRNIIISLAYNLLGGGLAVIGYVNPLVAAIIMPISSLSIVFSSSRNKAFNNK